MAYIDDLVERIADDSLRQQIALEVNKIVSRKEFGLVFERHLPQALEVPGVRPRRGDLVRVRSDETKANHMVLSTREGAATIVPVDASRTTVDGTPPKIHPFADLVVVKDFSDPIYPGLRPLGDCGWPGETPVHVVIEGENYYALETLLYTHAGKVDVIYIDPPYNTGSDDWQYNDRYVDSSDAYRHSKWLSFMERRLRHASRLLKDSGVLFVSIDDNEQAHLRLLLDQVFGAENFVDTIAVEMSTTSGPKVHHALRGALVKNTEFIHVYRKSSEFARVRHTPLFDGVDGWDYKYAAWLFPDGKVGSFVDQLLADADVRADIERLGLLSRGRFSHRKMDLLLAASSAARDFVASHLDEIARFDRAPVALASVTPPAGEYVTVTHGGRDYILAHDSAGKLKQVFPLSMNYRLSDDHVPRFGRTVIRGDFWKGFHRDMARVDQEGGVPFGNGKKPVRLIKQLIRWANNDPNAVILDFFGGSGTTTHAVMEMNASDGGKRQSILVTNNELSKAQHERFVRAGVYPGAEDYEARGVFRSVTKPRIEAAARATGEAVGFFKLTYEDENLVALGRKFDAVAPLLWLKAGATGTVLERTAGAPWSVSDAASYSILFDTSRAREFAALMVSKPECARRIFIVTNSESTFQAVVTYLPPELRLVTTRLYSDYLRSFEINGKD